MFRRHHRSSYNQSKKDIMCYTHNVMLELASKNNDTPRVKKLYNELLQKRAANSNSHKLMLDYLIKQEELL